MMNPRGKLTLKILSPEGLLFEEEGLDAVNIPLADGYPIGIRPGHAPLIAETLKGKIHYRSVHQEDEVLLHAGVLDIRDNVVILLTAGKVEKTSESLAEPVPTEYDRLMQSLIQQIQTEDHDEQETL
jgi:F0F1-type ATP synthase epsilon subunit